MARRTPLTPPPDLDPGLARLIGALARSQARQDWADEQRLRAERHEWNGVVVLGKVYDSVEDYNRTAGAHHDEASEQNARSAMKAKRKVTYLPMKASQELGDGVNEIEPHSGARNSHGS